ncbi:type III-B CRISPR module RAMP protein Cmr4 [Thermoanaerobacterium sp. DL9XJH110]|uniref:type III-B CRISPR module RAMP protein Cmr4 n=1 Tax=Thermoanaerobacterium sp. DL9XJH110 TaxID=3386643 RepID=UPI003BB6D84D
MFKLARPFFMICETPLHAGSGNDLGIVDLPIQRERHTDFPKVESSSLKGCIREAFENLNEINFNGIKLTEEALRKETIMLAFGPEEGDLHAGALGFTDARILLFPVKSMKGVFAWITCPEVLERFKNDLLLSGIKDFPELPEANTVPYGSNLLLNENKVILEEYTFNVERPAEGDKCTKFAKWLANKIFPSCEEYKYWLEKMEKDIAVLSDDDFRDFVSLSTEVVTRTRIDPNTGTVKSGALFTEEYLPAESVLYSLVLASPVFSANKGIFKKEEKKEEEMILEFFCAGLPGVIQLGGNATLGKGIIRTRIMGVE